MQNVSFIIVNVTAIGVINRVVLMNFSVAVLLSLAICSRTPDILLYFFVCTFLIIFSIFGTFWYLMVLFGNLWYFLVHFASFWNYLVMFGTVW